MKKAIFLVSLFVFLLWPLPSLAQSDPVVSPQGEFSGKVASSSSAQDKSSITSSVIKPSLDILLARLNASQVRLEKIKDRLSSRWEKIKQTGAKNNKLNSDLTSLIQQIGQINAQKDQQDSLVTNLLKNPDKTTYALFRKQIQSNNNNLKNILASEKTIIGQLKQYTVKNATPSVVIVPTK